jgi:transposase
MSANFEEQVISGMTLILDRLERLEQRVGESVIKEGYSTDEVAERLRRRPFTVRGWCRLGQVRGAKKVKGKGRTGEWRIPHEELSRLEADGPAPIGTYRSM